MDAVMVARRTSFIVVTPLCFFITARYRGTAHVPRLVLLPDVSGSTKGDSVFFFPTEMSAAARFFRVLGDPTRLKILELLGERASARLASWSLR